MPMNSLADAFIEELRDILGAERLLMRALPQLAKGASCPKLSELIHTHLEETKGQLDRLEQTFEVLGLKSQAKKCAAMEGLLAEAEDVLRVAAPADVLDALLIAELQKIEHYEIATYGTLGCWAQHLGYPDIQRLLELNEKEETHADVALTELAEEHINPAALVPDKSRTSS